MSKPFYKQTSIGAIILAAGKSERFGAPKVLQFFKDVPFLVRIVDSLSESGILSICLVLGHQADKIKEKLPKIDNVRIVINDDYECGQFSSLQAGIRALPNSMTGCLICLIDQPHIQPQIIKKIIAESNPQTNKIIIPSYGDRSGHPVYVPDVLFHKIKNSTPTISLRTIFSNHVDLIHRIHVDNALIIEDIDTPDDLKKVEKLFALD